MVNDQDFWDIMFDTLNKTSEKEWEQFVKKYDKKIKKEEKKMAYSLKHNVEDTINIINNIDKNLLVPEKYYYISDFYIEDNDRFKYLVFNINKEDGTLLRKDYLKFTKYREDYSVLQKTSFHMEDNIITEFLLEHGIIND